MCRSTGAGRDCGTCVLSVKHAMRAAQSTSAAAVAAMATDLADGLADEVAWLPGVDRAAARVERDPELLR